jgi:hypothetical protein
LVVLQPFSGRSANTFAFIRNSPELATAYADTLGDLALGLTGSTLTSVVAVLMVSRRRRAAGQFA